MISGGLFFFNLSLSAIAAPPPPADSIVLTLSGNNYFSTDYLLGTIRRPRTAADVEKLIGRILDLYADAGFALCTVSPMIDRGEDRMNVVLEISEGDRIMVRSYEFRTGGRTSPGALRRLSRLSENSYFSFRDIENAKRAFAGTGVFSSVTERIAPRADGYAVIFDMTEVPTDYLNGSGSIAQGHAVLGASYQSASVLGTLRRFAFSYESGLPTSAPGQFRSEFILSFSEPVLIAPVTLDLHFAISNHDTARLTVIDGRIAAPVGRHLEASVLSGWEAVDYLADTSRQGYRNSLVGIGTAVSFAGAGTEYRQDIAVDYLFRSHDRLRFTADIAVTWRSFSVKPHGAWMRTDRPEYFDFFHLGGARDIRGYTEGEFTVERAAWLNIEYKRLPVYPLIDLAWLNDAYVYSYGFGIDARSSIADASLIFAWPWNGAWNDGKVHFFLQKAL